MALIAQLTDFHLLEPGWRDRSREDLLRVAFLSSYRPLAAERRVARVRAALRAAVEARPDHVVLTGDLTEDGSPAQLSLLAELLLESALDPRRVTIVPGNHDAYRGGLGFEAALEGPLADFAETSRNRNPIDLGDAWLLPVDSTIDQHYVRAAGNLGGAQRDRVEALADEGRTVLVAQHHPPLRHSCSLLSWFQELVDLDAATDLVARRSNVHVIHGHVHRRADHALPGESRARVFSAHATVQHDAPLRLYDVDARGVRPV